MFRFSIHFELSRREAFFFPDFLAHNCAEKKVKERREMKENYSQRRKEK